jgi:hypothetical protein
MLNATSSPTQYLPLEHSARADVLRCSSHNAVHTIPPHSPLPPHSAHTAHTFNRKRPYDPLRPRFPRCSFVHPKVGIYHPNPEVMGGSKGSTRSRDGMGRNGCSKGNEEDMEED